MQTRYTRLLGSFLLISLTLLGCNSGDLITPATTGTLEITTATVGAEPDPDGYTVQVDGGAAQAIGVSASLQTGDLAPGEHTVQLGGMAANCALGGGNPQTVSVTAGETATVSFALTCAASTGGIQVGVSSSGAAADPDGFTVSVDGSDRGTLAPSGAVDVGGLTAGAHLVGLGGIAANCRVPGDNPQTVTIVAGQNATATFSVACSAAPAAAGALQLHTTTTGADPDADGYAFALDGGGTQPVGVNAAATVANIAAGSHSVRLSGVAKNCVVQTDNPHSVAVAAGATAEVSFAVGCSGTTGTIQVNVSSTGSPADPDGYTVKLDGKEPGQAVAVTGSTTFSAVPNGSHTLTLTGVAQNCAVVGGPSQRVSLTVGATVAAGYEVRCSSQISWVPMASGTNSTLTGVWGTSPTNVFAVGDQGGIYRFDGAGWTESYRAGFGFRDVWAGTAADGFAVGRFNFPSLDDVALYNGANWTPSRAGDPSTDEAFNAVWGSSATDVFAVGTTFDDGLIMHYDGSTWSKSLDGGYGEYTDVTGTSPTSVYVVGTSYIPDGDPGTTKGNVLRFDGAQWVTVYSEPGLNPTGVWAGASSDVYVVGLQGTILHFDGQRWSHMKSPTKQNLKDVWGTSGTDVYAVGDAGTILHYDGSRWSAVNPTSQTLFSVWGSSPSDLFAVGAGGTILHGTQ